MPEPQRASATSATPWVIAGIAGVAFIALLVVYFVPLASARNGPTTGHFSTAEQQAMSAAAIETVNIVSLRRAHFEADFNRALAGATGALKQDIQGKKAATLKTLTTGKFDLSAQVTHQALVGPVAKGNGYVVLVTINGYKSTAPSTPVPSNLEVTVLDRGGKYLASNVQNIALS